MSLEDVEVQNDNFAIAAFRHRHATGDFKDGLCELCSRHEETGFVPSRSYPRSRAHHISFEHLEWSSNHGCNLCALFRDGILDTHLRYHPKNFRSLQAARDELRREDSFDRIRVKHERPKDLLGIGGFKLERGPTNGHSYDFIMISRSLGGSSNTDTHHALFMISAQPNRGDILTNGNQVARGTTIELSAERDTALFERFNGNFRAREMTREPNFQLAKLWIDRCRHEHSCQQLPDSKVGPTRLVYVGSKENVYMKPKLVETDGKWGAYVCLSHRWSKSLKYITSKENYKDHIQGLDWNSLPKGFQDAIHATSALGYQFLWIDSLCIVQDDPADWESECPKMAAIYAGAQVTIAAPGAMDSDSGFLVPRFAERQPPSCRLAYRDRHGTISGIMVWYPAFPASEEVPSNPENNSVLNSRGWILQERLLSARVLYFGSHQLYLECNLCTNYEVLHYPILHTEARFGGFRKMKVDSESQEELFQRWLSIVKDFADRRLTFPMDKFPAISGIAKVINQQTSSDYLAGLWRDDLARGLRWINHQGRVQADQNFVEVGLPYRAPSWSWARSDCGTVKPEWLETWDKGQLCCKVLSAETELAGTDPFGKVKGGSLRVKGKTRWGVIRRVMSAGGLRLKLYERKKSYLRSIISLRKRMLEPTAKQSDYPIDFSPDNAHFGENLTPWPYYADGDDIFGQAGETPRRVKQTFETAQGTSAEYEIDVLTLLVSRIERLKKHHESRSGSEWTDYWDRGPKYDVYGMVLLPSDERETYSRLGLIYTIGLGSDNNIHEWFADAKEMTLKII